MDLLSGLSPWWWVAIAILLAAAEMITVTTVLISAAAAALATALCLWIFADLGGAGQIALFAGLSIAFTFIGRALVARYGDGAAAPGLLNRRTAQLIGREAVVIEFSGSEGRVSVDGMPWPARLAPGAAIPAAGERMRVIASDGIVLRIETIAR